MTSNHSSRAIFKHVLAWLHSKKLNPSKIALQKIIFYLKEKGLPLQYDFEPYSYGPFSRDVMNEARNLEINNEIQVRKSDYLLNPGFKEELSDAEKNKVNALIDEFYQLVDKDFSFDNLELYGTVLYCIRSLQDHGDNLNNALVEEEFKAWKGNKFPSAHIHKAYEKLTPVFQRS